MSSSYLDMINQPGFNHSSIADECHSQFEYVPSSKLAQPKVPRMEVSERNDVTSRGFNKAEARLNAFWIQYKARQDTADFIRDLENARKVSDSRNSNKTEYHGSMFHPPISFQPPYQDSDDGNSEDNVTYCFQKEKSELPSESTSIKSTYPNLVEFLRMSKPQQERIMWRANEERKKNIPPEEEILRFERQAREEILLYRDSLQYQSTDTLVSYQGRNKKYRAFY